MHPTDTTRTSGRYTRPVNRSKSQSICQDCESITGLASSGAILLLNFADSDFRDELALTLSERRHKVFIPETNGKTLSELQLEELRQANFVIFDLSRVNHDIWSQLRGICRLRKQDGTPVMVMCCTRVYRGPEFQLLVEKLGARLVYAK